MTSDAPKKKPRRCRCQLTLDADGKCPEGCPPARSVRRETTGRKDPPAERIGISGADRMRASEALARLDPLYAQEVVRVRTWQANAKRAGGRR